MVSFSVMRRTPPLRLTSMVSAVCEMVWPVGETHEASTGMRKLTRSLWRRPSVTVLIVRDKLTYGQASMRERRREERRGWHLSFRVITERKSRTGRMDCYLFGRVRTRKGSRLGRNRAN